MWCRVLLASVAFAYILCVLLLNGLQKEDMDVEMLAKLQRHNVNIDDLNNENLRNECTTAIEEGKNTDDKKDFAKYNTPNINDKNKTSESNLRNVIINYFHNVQKPDESLDVHEAQHLVTQPSTNCPNINQFMMNIWNMMGKQKEQDTVAKYTTKAIETSTTLTKEQLAPNKQTGDKNIEYINNILESLLATQKITTTSRPTTKKVDFDIIAQKIKKILTQIKDGNPTTPVTTVAEVGNDLNNISEIIKLAKELNIFGPSQESHSSSTISQIKHQNSRHNQGQYLVEGVNPKEFTIQQDQKSNQNIRPNNDIKSVSEDIIREISEGVKVKILQDLKREAAVTEKLTSPTTTPSMKSTTIIKKEEPNDSITKQEVINQDQKSNHNIRPNNDIKTVSEDIIREISESVKVKVLQDLKREHTVTEKLTSPTTTPSMKTTTIIKKEDTNDSITKQEVNKPKVDAKITLEQFMEIFQQFKASKELNLAPTTTKVNKITTETNPFMKISYPHKAADNSLNIKFHPLNITSIIINPINPFLHTDIPNEPYAVLNINTPVDAKHQITQMDIINTKDSFQPAPMTIQTNSVEVPPLGFPVPPSIKVVYQNIIVTTKHPTTAKHYNQPRYTAYAKTKEHDKEINKYIKYRTNDYNGKRPTFQSREKNDFTRFGFGTMNRHTDYNNNDNENNTHKAIKHHGRIHHNNHGVQKFHEKLENANGQLLNSRERNNGDSSKPETRHQHPINEKIVRTRYDDAHFRHFLKTQQKVNDMLERILATKKIGVPSVETIV